MQDALNEDERRELNNFGPAVKKMRLQWNTAPDAASTDLFDEYQLLKKIQQAVWRTHLAKRVFFYKIYSIVASVLLILGIGSVVYFLISKEEIVQTYVVSSGIQHIQSVTLPDGTVVLLGPGSTLTYPVKFTGTIRKVSLEGQAFFDVVRDPQMPFIVHTSDMDVQALGTTFELFSYPIEKKSEAILLSGKIKVDLTILKSNEKKEFMLYPNDKILFDKQSGVVSKSVVDADKYMLWRKEKVICFDNEKLSMIIPRLEHWYGQKIQCPKDIADNYCFAFKVKDESLERILFMIGELSPIKYIKSDKGEYSLELKKEE